MATSVRTLGFKAFTVTIPTPAMATPLMLPSNADRYTTEFEVHNINTNSGAVFVGLSDVLSTTHIPRNTNTTTSFSAIDVPGEPKHFDLSKIYVTGTAGDTMRVQYRTMVD